MSGVLHAEVVALDRTCETLTDRRTDDVNDLAFVEQVDFDFRTRLQIGTFVLTQAEFPQPTTRLLFRFCEMAGEGFADAIEPARASCDLEGAISRPSPRSLPG